MATNRKPEKKVPGSPSHTNSPPTIGIDGFDSNCPKMASSQSSWDGAASQELGQSAGLGFRPNIVPRGWHHDDETMTSWPNEQWEKLQMLVTKHHEPEMKLHPVLGFCSKTASRTMVFWGDHPGQPYGAAFYMQEGAPPMMHHPITLDVFKKAFKPSIREDSDPRFVTPEYCLIPRSKENTSAVIEEIENYIPEWWSN